MTSSKTILGIDPGIATIGFGIIRKENTQIIVEDFGVITTPAGMEIGERLHIIEEDIAHILSMHLIDFVCIEKLFWGANVTNALQVAQARGIIVHQIWKNKIPMKEFAPNEIKSQIVGYGKAPKIQVQNVLKMRLSLPSLPTPDDAADALALALLGSEEIE